jgi:general secretion pathway protein D
MKLQKNIIHKSRWFISLAMAIFIQLLSQSASNADNLNMKDANIRVLIEAVSRITGKTFVLDPRINNQKITILSPSDVDLTQDQIYANFLSH